MSRINHNRRCKIEQVAQAIFDNPSSVLEMSMDGLVGRDVITIVRAIEIVDRARTKASKAIFRLSDSFWSDSSTLVEAIEN
jgi:hypothetical protein